MVPTAMKLWLASKRGASSDRRTPRTQRSPSRISERDLSGRLSNWPSAKARRVLAALARIGWQIKRQSGSHKTLARPDWPDFIFAFHDDEEIGPRMLARIAKRTGLTQEDL